MKTKDQLIEEYRHVLVDDCWYECVEENFKEEMASQGIYVSQIAFDLHSQGAGAQFSGDINCKLFMEKHFKPDEYPVVWHLLALGGSFSIKISLGGRNAHQYAAHFENYSYGFEYSDAAEFGDDHVALWNTALESIEDAFFEDCESALRDRMGCLFDALQEEYDYLTADHVIWDWIVDSELDEVEEDEEEDAA